jgi:ribokinase
MAVQMARLNGACDFYTGLGDDELGHRAVAELSARGVTVHVDWLSTPTRRAITHVDRNGERTITTIGPKLLPRGPLPLDGTAIAFFVAGDVEALRSARAAKFLGATTRELPTLQAGAVHLDLLVGSGNDPGEAYHGELDADVVVATDGARGGTANGRGYDAAPIPGPIADTYGAGDTFGCTLCFALGRGDALDDALALAARESAEVLTLRGPYREL